MASFVSKKYLVPFALITSLFFLWGFARSILDVLNKHFQEYLSISISQSALVQGMTYSGYFLMAIPAGLIISRGGYRRGIVGGLILFAAGAFLFIPGETARSFPLFLAALFLIGCGLAMLETSANPYAAELGEPATAASRLNLAQAFNGLGCILGPVIVGGFLFSSKDAHVALPYSLMGAAVLLFAIVFLRVPLPVLEENRMDSPSESCDSGKLWLPESSARYSNVTESFQAIGRLLSSKPFMAGWTALFFYEIAEIAINSLFINYTTADGWLTRTEASAFLSFGALALFMMARVVGSFLMKRMKAEKLLTFCALLAMISAFCVAINLPGLSTAALLGCYAFEAIIFPTIFALSITHVGRDAKMASSLMMMTPIGGAVGTILMSLVAEHASVSISFLVPAFAFLPVFIYALNRFRK